MQLIQKISHLRKKFKNPVLTLGNFDGLHLAHQRIIKQVVRQAKQRAGTSVVVTFNPHPVKALEGLTATSLITTVGHKIDLIRYLGVDVCLLLDFNQQFSKTTAEDFIKDQLIKQIGMKYLIIGQGFRFGKNRRGDINLLRRLAKRYDFKLGLLKPVKINGRIISSSRIRSLIRKGRVAQVNRLLGRMFSISGRVNPGSARGRNLGFPTANIIPDQEIIPASGVYAVYIKLNQKVLPGVLNIGIRPTFSQGRNAPHFIEVHIFNFSNNIYRKKLEVFFVRRIRPEKRFNSHQALINQIKKDALTAKKILRPANRPAPKQALI
ncbi:bifunctional riboflavin kinase/FAD synthetase [Candidatus Omnitrophota bacterium]